MSVLEFRKVSIGFRRQPSVLRDVTFTVDRGEMAAVWGVRHSGKTTLLRAAAGLIRPQGGTVTLNGDPVRDRTAATGWFEPTLSSYQSGTVAEHVAVPLLPRRVGKREALMCATAMLRRVGVPEVASRNPRDLKPVELVYAGIARALVTRPLLLLADEPASTVGTPDADPIFELLRSIADEGVAVLVTIGVGDDAPRADRQLTLGGGDLRDLSPTVADVVPILR